MAWTCGKPLLTRARLAAIVRAALTHGGRPELALELVFVDVATLAALHGEWLDDPTHTDVMTFDLGDEFDGPAGELYVSVERARDVARRRGLSAERELALYVVHGALHLCGFDDREPRERARMRRAERAVFDALERTRERSPRRKTSARRR